MDPSHDAACSSSSSVDDLPYSFFLSDEGEGSSDLEGQCHQGKMVIASEMRKKRLSFGRSSRDDEDPPSSSFLPLPLSSSHMRTQKAHSCLPSADATMPPPGILRQGRFTSKIRINTSSLSPRRRRCCTLMIVTAAFACLICAASYFLNGGRQLLPLTDAGAYLRKLKGESERVAGYEGMMAWLNAETSGLPAEERQRVSVIIMHMRYRDRSYYYYQH